jgi:hypothetical protein
VRWHPIETLPRDEDGVSTIHPIAVGWWFSAPGMGRSWETDVDEFNDGATHWCELPQPPVQS